jgi:hypothetical protein
MIKLQEIVEKFGKIAGNCGKIAGNCGKIWKNCRKLGQIAGISCNYIRSGNPGLVTWK